MGFLCRKNGDDGDDDDESDRWEPKKEEEEEVEEGGEFNAATEEIFPIILRIYTYIFLDVYRICLVLRNEGKASKAPFAFRVTKQ